MEYNKASSKRFAGVAGTAVIAVSPAVAAQRTSRRSMFNPQQLSQQLPITLALPTITASRVDPRPALIIEIGTRLTRIGYAGEYVPREIFRTEWLDLLQGPSDKLCPQPVFDRRYTEHEQYEMLVKFLKDIVFRKLVTSICSRRIVLVESLLTPSWKRQALAHAFFDCPSLGPHSILFAPSHLLCSFPFNAHTCLVLDMGADEAVSFPIAEGILMLNQWETSSVVSASALEQNVKRLMLRYGRVSRRSISMQERDAKNCEDVSSDDKIDDQNSRKFNERDLELAESMRLWEDIVVRYCFVTTAARGRRLQAHLSDPESNAYERPVSAVELQFGSELLNVPGIVREGAAELLFMKSDEAGTRSVAQMLLDCIAKASIDLRRELLKNLLIIGGISRLPGFLSRLRTELLDLIADGYHPQLVPSLVDIKFYQFPKQVAGQLFCAWIGGSMFGALDDMLEQHSLTRRQWLATRRVPDWTDAIDDHFAESTNAQNADHS